MMVVFTCQRIVFAYCLEQPVHRARQLVLQRLMRQDMKFFDQPENSPGPIAGFLSTKATDLAGVSRGTLGTTLIAISTIVSALVVSLIFGWKLALVCAAVIPILVACGYL